MGIIHRLSRGKTIGLHSQCVIVDMARCYELSHSGLSFSFLSVILSYRIPLSPSLLQISPIRITMMPSPGHIYYRQLAMKTPIVFPLESLWIIPMSYATCPFLPYDS